LTYSIAALADSYKYSHYNQYPPGTKKVHSYLESRGGEYDEIVFFGLQYYIKKYLMEIFFPSDIERIANVCEEHGVPFYKEGWLDLVEKYRGKYLPIKIKAVPEGYIAKPHEVLMTVENTDPQFYWLTSFLETLLLKVWYPTTVATKAHYVKKILKHHWNKTVDEGEAQNGINFAYHNFGDRGSSSVETALIGGFAHLTQFYGSDNFNAVAELPFYYGSALAVSIPATEHSTVTTWGSSNEYKMVEEYVRQYKDWPMVACVLDSYNIYEAVKAVTNPDSIIRKMVEYEDGPIFVIRPDSGEPLEVLEQVFNILEENQVAYTENSKGYKELKKYRIIWSDGINPHQIDRMLGFIEQRGYAASNMAFGSGGDIMQNVTRDTCKFAFKCSAVEIDGQWYDVFKDPITDPGKQSKAGKQEHDHLTTVYDAGALRKNHTMEEIRTRSDVVSEARDAA